MAYLVLNFPSGRALHGKINNQTKVKETEVFFPNSELNDTRFLTVKKKILKF